MAWKKQDILFEKIQLKSKLKLNLQYTRDITLKPVMSGGVHLRGLAPGNTLQRNVAAVASRRRHCVRFNGTGDRSQTSCAASDVSTALPTGRYMLFKNLAINIYVESGSFQNPHFHKDTEKNLVYNSFRIHLQTKPGKKWKCKISFF